MAVWVYVDGWFLAVSEDSHFEEGWHISRHMVKVVFVQSKEWISRDREIVYEPCSWRIGQIGKRGVYPILPWKMSWFLDRSRTTSARSQATTGTVGSCIFHHCTWSPGASVASCHRGLAARPSHRADG